MEKEYKYMVCTKCLTYNHSHYIEDTLGGFAMQKTNFPAVFCIVDDASTDGEQDILRKWAKENLLMDNRETTYWQKFEFGEQIVARLKTSPNLLFVILLLNYNHHNIKRPKGPYIAEWYNNAKYTALCEGDDHWTAPMKLQMQVDFLEKHNDFSLCFGDVRYYNCKKETDFIKRKALYGKQNLKLEYKPKDEVFYDILLGKVDIKTLSVVYRNSCKEKIRTNSVHFMMGDTPLWLDLSQQGKIKYIDVMMGIYNIHDGSAAHSTKSRSRFYLSMFEMRAFYCQKYNYQIPKEIKRNYNFYYINCMIKGIVQPQPLFDLFDHGKISMFHHKYLKRKGLYYNFYISYPFLIHSKFRKFIRKTKKFNMYLINKL